MFPASKFAKLPRVHKLRKGEGGSRFTEGSDMIFSAAEGGPKKAGVQGPQAPGSLANFEAGNMREIDFP